MSALTFSYSCVYVRVSQVHVHDRASVCMRVYEGL